MNIFLHKDGNGCRAYDRRLVLMLLTVAVVLFAFLAGCAAGRKTQSRTAVNALPAAQDSVKPPAPPIDVPPGVDSSVARTATVTAREVLVGFREDSVANAYRERATRFYEEGQPLYEAFRNSRLPKREVAAADSTVGDELGVRGDQLHARGVQTLGKKNLTDLSDENRAAATGLFESARDFYERALQLNPWDQNSRAFLIETYQILADLRYTASDYAAAIESINRWLALDGDDPGYIARLGRCHINLGDSLKALLAYRQAEDRLLTWTGFPVDLAPDTSRAQLSPDEMKSWINFVRWQYVCELSLGLADDAIRDLERCIAICEAAGDTATANSTKRELDALAWDSGDLAALRLRNQFWLKWNAGELEDARKVLNELLPMLNNPQAEFDAHLWAARLDFDLQEYEASLSGMRALLSREGFAEVDSSLDSLLLTRGAAELAAALSKQREQASEDVLTLIDLYGGACLEYAVQIEQQRNDRERAYVYYYQSALVPWKARSRALFNLADLSVNDPARAARYGEAAIQSTDANVLTTAEKQRLLEVLVKAYRRLNDKPRAEYYYQQFLAAAEGAKP